MHKKREEKIMKKKVNYLEIFGFGIILAFIVWVIYLSPYRNVEIGLFHHLTFILSALLLGNIVIMFVKERVAVRNGAAKNPAKSKQFLYFAMGGLMALALAASGGCIIFLIGDCFFPSGCIYPDLFPCTNTWLYLTPSILLPLSTICAVFCFVRRKTESLIIHDGRCYYSGETYHINPFLGYPPDVFLNDKIELPHKTVFLHCNDGLYVCDLTTTVRIDLEAMHKSKPVRELDYDAWLKKVGEWVDFCLEARRLNATLGELVRDKRESRTEIVGIPVIWENETEFLLK
jgi:hypothetical protein